MTTLSFTINNIVRQGDVLTVFAQAASAVPHDSDGEPGSQHVNNAQTSFEIINPVDPTPFIVGASFTLELADVVAAPPTDGAASPAPTYTDSPLYGSGMPAQQPVV